jgi:hypothetical protein
VGIYIASFTLGKKKICSVMLPSLSAVLVTLLMYIGEMVLLSGNLYRFGNGAVFVAIPGIVLAPFDILVILISGAVTAIICSSLTAKNK